MLNILRELTRLHGPSGHEQSVSYYIKEKVESLCDTVKMDNLGNVTAVKNGGKPGPAVILTAHMDEVGFIVKKVEANGLLRFEKLGGHDDRILLGQKVEVQTKEGTLLGVIGTISAHYAKFDDPKKVRNYRHLYVDIGASSKEQAEALGVEIGDTITWTSEMRFLGNENTGKLIGKAFDDRAGCTVLLKLMEELNQQEAFPGKMIFIFTVQEEVGLRGATVAASDVQADVAIAVDTTAVSDTPEETMDNSLYLGAGTGIKMMDFSLIAHPTVRARLVELAKEYNIDFQSEVFPGIGTDGGAVSLANKGISTGVLSIPSRYAHSPTEVIDMEDLKATKELIKAFILSLDSETEFPF
ncbi:MAG TPA: M42 family metallopeptidase [Bacillales bacterium]